jgi:hypothetical protein
MIIFLELDNGLLNVYTKFELDRFNSSLLQK